MGAAPGALGEWRKRAVERAEREYLRRVLADQGGRIGAAAAVAGISPRQLHKLLTRHGIRKEDFRLPPRR